MKNLLSAILSTGFLVVMPVFAIAGAQPMSSRETITTHVHGKIAELDHIKGLVVIRETMPKNVGMAPRLASFKVADPEMLDDIREGDEVNALVGQRNGQPAVVEIHSRL
jgi:Cu/Ag efflux protein CusF